MNILGICDGHDSGVALLKNGKLTFAISEERLTLRKRQSGFPYHSLNVCFRYTGSLPEEIKMVAYGEVYGRLFTRLLDSHYRRVSSMKNPLSLMSKIYMYYQNLVPKLFVFRYLESKLSEHLIRMRLEKLKIRPLLLIPVQHHLAHAFAAAFTSGTKDALVVTLDGYGDGLSGTVSILNDGKLSLIKKIGFRHSLGIVFGIINHILGFKEGEEGKVVALAGYGNSDNTYTLFQDIIRCEGLDIIVETKIWRAKFLQNLMRFKKEDLAAALQKRVEDVVTVLISNYLKYTQKKFLCCAGGLFANIKLNQKLKQIDNLDGIYVFPHMGDGGLSVGAALKTLYDLNHSLQAPCN